MDQAVVDQVQLADTKQIQPPDPDREPLKANVFERMAKGAAQLMPLFPYDHPGAIVPCGSVLIGGPEESYGQFFHWNTVSEVVVCYGSHNSALAPAQIIATRNLHGVNSRLSDERDPDAFAVIMVTQHQAEDGAQAEAMIARCSNCHAEILRHDYDSTPPKPEDSRQIGVRQFPTTVGSARFAELRNTDEIRACSECGYRNEPFPTAGWGWSRQVKQTTAANAAEHALRRAASAAAAPTDHPIVNAGAPAPEPSL
ncbi:hypothetical protein KO481_40375 [Nocardia sp. NEAU-G5]|uniref:Uncharacterized protein n=1 Tax=Nocardia albiluteola TaxID=2842303 RepID=A0ABS6BCB2_9NOCA|nr:hypothetical protein [Nocardia albiluteola]MBU3067763.1 hypothetical protein [Nocardia albiluteola]